MASGFVFILLVRGLGAGPHCQPVLGLVIEMVRIMLEVSVAEAKARLSSLLDAVEAGQPVVITRRGRSIAQLVPQRSVQDLLPRLEALRAALPHQNQSGVDTVRRLRDDERA
jgi:prevent-host-death family protein